MKLKPTRFAFAAFLTIVAGAASAQTTLGTGAFAQSGVSIGRNAMSGDVAAGFFSPTQPAYTGAIAIGNGANASGKNIAIGDGINAPQDGIEGNYTLAIGGLNYNTGTIDLRRVVGMANGIFANDGATLGQVQNYYSLANSYTDTRFGEASARLDAHDVQLQNHEMRITNLEGLVGGFDGRLTSLENKVNQTRKEAFQGIAAVAAMNVEVPALAPGEQAVVAGVGAYGGQAAVSVGYVRSNFAGQVFSAKVGVSGGKAAFSAGGGWKF